MNTISTKVFRILSMLALALALGACGTAPRAADGPTTEAAQALLVKPGDSCTSAPTITLTDHGTLLGGTLVGKVNDYSSTIPGCGDTANISPDAAVKMIAPSAGVLEMQVIGDSYGSFIPSLYLRSASACGMDLLCSDDPTGIVYPSATLWTDIEAGTYAAIVDGHGAGAGPFSLRMALHPRVCGDGVVSPGEQCDGGGYSDTDGCGDPGTPDECQIEAPASPNS